MTGKKIFSAVLLIIGIIILFQIGWPLISYKIWEAVNLQGSSALVSPTASDSTFTGVSVKDQNNFPAFVSDIKRQSQPTYNEFNLSVPKIDLNTVVYVDSNDLDKGPALLPGTSLPGERGNAFISGHSYALIKNNFSELTKLKPGDQIILSVGETNLTYSVIGSKVVDPKDLSVIAPPDSIGRFVTLMTCVPPGLNVKRLVVLASLI